MKLKPILTFRNCSSYFHVHCLLPNENKFFKIERENGCFGYVHYCQKHQISKEGKIQTMQDIIKASKGYQRDNIEILEKINKKMAEDWLSADFFDFNHEENIKPINIIEKKPSQDLLYSDYPIKKKKTGTESFKENQVQSRPFSDLTPSKRAKKVKKHFSPTNSVSKKKISQNSHQAKEKEKPTQHQNEVACYRTTATQRTGKNDEENEKHQLKKIKSEERRKNSKMVLKYPNFLDDNRETYF